MPRMDGLQLLEKLQEDKIKATVVMVSTLTTKDADVTIRALENGAIDFVTKPTNISEAKGEDFKQTLLTVLTAVMNSRAYTRTLPRTAVSVAKPEAKANFTRLKAASSKNKLIALACSTGGPKALQSVIPKLPKNLDAPMVLVQHMPVGFTKSMADRLNETSQISVKEAEEGDDFLDQAVSKGYIELPECAKPQGYTFTTEEINAVKNAQGVFSYTIDLKWGKTFNYMNPGFYYDNEKYENDQWVAITEDRFEGTGEEIKATLTDLKRTFHDVPDSISNEQFFETQDRYAAKKYKVTITVSTQ